MTFQEWLDAMPPTEALTALLILGAENGVVRVIGDIPNRLLAISLLASALEALAGTELQMMENLA